MNLPLIFFTIWCVILSTITRAADKPNILYILADDLGFSEARADVALDTLPVNAVLSCVIDAGTGVPKAVFFFFLN